MEILTLPTLPTQPTPPTPLSQFTELSLINPTAARYITIAAIAIFALAALLSLTRSLLALLLAAIPEAALVFCFRVWPNPFPGEVPDRILLAAFASLFIAAGVLVMRRRRLILAVLLIPSLATTYLVANLTYRQYPNVGALLPPTNVVQMNYENFQTLTKAPTRGGRQVGALVTVPLAGTSSHLPARPAIAYVPPAYWTQPGLRLPVLVLLAGSPGGPSEWFRAGGANDAADSYQRSHDGVSPIIVSVDGTSSALAQPACVDGPQLKIQSYLANDVPELLKSRFRVQTDQSKWSIGGLSYGGTCAFQIAVNSPRSYGTFLDFSGESEPTSYNHKHTVQALFHGSEAAFQAVNAADVLRRVAQAVKGADRVEDASSVPGEGSGTVPGEGSGSGSDKGDSSVPDNTSESDLAKARAYRQIAGKFICGKSDHKAIETQDLLAPLARAVGMNIEVKRVEGAHNYQTWRTAIHDTIGFVATRGGL